jgi:plastocyanin
MRRTLVCLAAATLALPLVACGGSDDGASGCTAAGNQVTVKAKDELKFDADSYTADTGCLEITYENTGSVAHTLLIEDEPGFKLAIGSTDKGSIDLEAGTYTLFCDVPGHEAAGMKADLVVG